MADIQLLLEAERRGILPPDKKALLDEARSRGLVTGGGDSAPTTTDSPKTPSAAPSPSLNENDIKKIVDETMKNPTALMTHVNPADLKVGSNQDLEVGKESPASAAFAMNALDSYGAGIPKRGAAFIDALIKKITGKGESVIPEASQSFGNLYDESLDANKNMLSGMDQAHPIASTAGEITGFALPGGVFMKSLGVGSKAAKIAEEAPFIGKLLSGPFMKGAISTGIGNTIYGQVQSDFDSSLKDRGTRAGIDAIIGGLTGGLTNKLFSAISNKIGKARAPQEVERILKELDEAFGTIKDPAERAQTISKAFEEVSSGQSQTLSQEAQKVQDIINGSDQIKLGKISNARTELGSGFPVAEPADVGQQAGQAIVDELNTTAKNIQDFYAKYTKGNTTPTQTSKALNYISNFFKRNGMMDETGNWLDKSGNVSDTFVPRYGVGKTSEAQQKFLAERFNDLAKAPELQHVSDIRQTIQREAFGGQNPLFGGDSKSVGKGLSTALKQDEEQAIKELYGEDIYNEFLNKKGEFSKLAGPVKQVARKIGLTFDQEGNRIIGKDPTDVLDAITNLSANELSGIKPVLEKAGAWDGIRNHLLNTLVNESPEQASRNIQKFGQENLSKFFTPDEIGKINSFISNESPDAARTISFGKTAAEINRGAEKAMGKGIYSPGETQSLANLSKKSGDVLANQDALSTVQRGYQNIGKKLADNPEFFKAFQKTKELLPEDAINQIKADYLQRIVERAKGDNSALAHQLEKLPDTAKRLIFSDKEIQILNELQKQAGMVSKSGFLMRLISRAPGAAKISSFLPDRPTEALIRETPDNVIDFVKYLAEKGQSEKAKIPSRVISNSVNSN